MPFAPLAAMDSRVLNMIVITTSDHVLHDPASMAPMADGRPFYDRAARAEQLLSAVQKLGLPTEPAPDHGLAPIAAIHDRGYLDFLDRKSVV